jgi:hypothetical protein
MTDALHEELCAFLSTPPVYTGFPERNKSKFLLNWIAVNRGLFYSFNVVFCRSKWLRGLRRVSEAVRLLGLRVRIPPGKWTSLVSVVCCQVEVSASDWSLIQRSPTECGVSECDGEASIMKRPWPTRGCQAIGKTNVALYYNNILKPYYSPLLCLL